MDSLPTERAVVATLPESGNLRAAARRLGRYELLRVIGSGGMGAVYEAHDTELDRRVALKLLRDRRADDSTWTRLRREAQAMAKLAHPNVVAVYDVAVVDDQPYLTMELVDGVSLSAWLAERPRSFREILDAFVQAGRGLAAAHAVGIVHRDFKPDNVLVAKSGRVCVTDFGVAARLDDASASVTGTPAFMAPEQMSAGPVDARADVFAFSVALYAALYGTRPFSGTTLVELRNAIVEQRVNAPVKKGAPSWVREALLVGLRSDPEARYATMEELLAAIDPSPRARRYRRALALAAAVALACAGAAGVRIAAKRSTARELVAPGGDATRTAVVVVDDAASGRDGAAEAVGPAVEAALASVPRVVVVDPASVARAVASERATGGVDPARLAAAVGAARVVLVELGDGRVTAKVDDAVPHKAPLYETSSRIAGGDWAGAARAVELDLVDAMGGRVDPARAAAAASVPANVDAALLMGRAIRAERSHDLGGAAALEGEACGKDTAAVAACVRRAALLFALGDVAGAAEAAETAGARAGGAPAEIRSEIDALRHLIAGDYDAAIAAYRDLWAAHGDDRGRALALAEAQRRAGKRDDATATIDALRARGVARGVDPDVDLFETDLRTLSYDDGNGGLEIARGVVARADAIGDRWLGARARRAEAAALGRIPGNGDSESVLVAARDLYAEENDPYGAAWVEMNIAVQHAKSGANADALAKLSDLEPRVRALGEMYLDRVLLGNLANVQSRSNRLVDAIATVEQLVEAWRGARNEAQLAMQLSNLCALQSFHGDLRAGTAACEEALAIRRKQNDHSGILGSLGNLANQESAGGSRDAAEAHAREALSLAVQFGMRVPHFRNLVMDQLVQQARWAEAEPLARAGIDEAIAQKAVDDEAAARAELARILAETGRAAEARAALAAAEETDKRATGNESRTVHALLFARARLTLATPADRSAVAAAMVDLEAEATRLQWLGAAVEARFLRARALGSAADLAAVEADARALGQVALADAAHVASVAPR